MRPLSGLVILSLLLSAVTVSAADPAITRRDGFLMLWQQIKRPAVAARTTPFTDVPKDSKGFLEITYAKARGLIDDGEKFYPDESLTMQDAVLWMMRTRNVDDIDSLTVAVLPELAKRYGLNEVIGKGSDGEPVIVSKTLTSQELQQLAEKFDAFLRDESHEVSLYSEKFHGKGTAFGETFDMYAMTAAHRTFPYNTLVRVTNIENGKSVTVRINDRGPFVPGRDMDLSLGAFTTIAERSKGKIRARLERLGDAILINAQAESSSLPTCASKGEQTRVSSTFQLTQGVPLQLGIGSPLTLSAGSDFSVLSIRLPGGTLERPRQLVTSGNSYTYTPSAVGEYRFTIFGSNGKRRTLPMKVVDCGQKSAPETGNN